LGKFHSHQFSSTSASTLLGDAVPITLQESLRGLLYAPYYAALAFDASRREGGLCTEIAF
jgi:hypothetical protein